MSDTEELMLVTGAAGFIGRPLCRRLKMIGKEVRALLRSRVQGPMAGDCLVPPWNEVAYCRLGEERPPIGLMHGVHTVFHLAAMVHAVSPSPEMEQKYWDVNLALFKSFGQKYWEKKYWIFSA